MKDLRYGFRLLAKRPGFTIVAVITLALGIGANTAIFSVVNGLLLRPLPYLDADRLAIIWTHSPGANVEQDWPSPGQYSAIKSQNTVFGEIAIAQGGNANITGQAAPERLAARVLEQEPSDQLVAVDVPGHQVEDHEGSTNVLSRRGRN